MTAATARQGERIEYRAPVQLVVPAGGAAGPRTLHARAVNVSERGIQVRTDRPLPIGESVTCSMLLEGRPKALAGRVRWARATAPGFTQPGVGIEFDGLSDDDSHLLRHLVSRASRGDQPVDLFFQGMSEPVSARAFMSDGGLHITAALPVLTREAPIEFRFHDGGPLFKGRIAQVAVRERGKTPHLEVELAVHAREVARFRHYTLYDAVEAPADDTRLDPPSETPTPARPRPTPLPALPKSLAARMPRAALLSLVALGGTLLALLMVWIMAAPGSNASSGTHPTRREAVQQPVPTPVPHRLPEAPLSAASPTSAPAALAPVAPPGASAPVVQVTAGVTEVLIPVSGTLEGMHVTRWVSPVAVVVELPHARLVTTGGTYFPKTGEVVRLSLTESARGTRVRAFLAAAPEHHEVTLRHGLLAIRIVGDHRGQPAPSTR